MNKQTPEHDADKIVTELIVALHDMRDKLVSASLILKDVQFEIDTEARNSVIEQTNALLQKVKA